MGSSTKYRGPRSWLRVGKYLLPVGLPWASWRPTAAPITQASIAQLAVDHPAVVQLQAVGAAESVAEFPFYCQAAGRNELRRLPAQEFSQPWVAIVREGLSYGRQCCAIGPARKAVRETGFHLNGDVRTSNVPISPFRLRYWRKRWTNDVTTRPWLPPKQRLAGRVATLNARYSHNYFHWLIEILPRLITMRQAGIEADYYLVDCLSRYQQDALAALGIATHQLIQPHFRLVLQADELVVPSFPSPECLRSCGQALLAGLRADAAVTQPRRVFISRRKTGTRTLSNEFEIETFLHRHDFETHFMEDYSLAQQARLMREAEIIVATHGAGLANTVFARPGTQVIEFVPAERFNYTCYPKRTRFFDLHHQLVFTTSIGDKPGLYVSVRDLAAALERAIRLPPPSIAA